MSSTAPGPRPREVTIGGWAIPIASAVLVVAVFDRMTTLRSVATRDALTTFLADGWAKGFGITVDDALTLIRASLFVAGTAAAVTGVLGIFVLQRHARARLALTVAAVPVVLTAPVVGGLLGIVVGVSTGMLWTRPARDWFAGRPPTLPETARPGPRPGADRVGAFAEPARDEHNAPPGPPVPPVPTVPTGSSPGPSPTAPPPTPGWGQPPAPSYPDPAAGSYPPPYPPVHAGAPPHLAARSARVPTQVKVACLLTWVFSLVTGGLYLLLLLAIAVDRGEVVDVLHDNPDVRDVGLTDRELIGLLVAMSGVVLLWCLAASLLAVLTWRRHAWARVLLLVSVGAAAVFEMLALPFSALHLAACVIAFVLLLQPASRAWAGSTGRTAPPSWPAGPPGPPAPPPGWPPTPPPGWPQESGQHQAPPVAPPPAASPPPDPPPPDRPSGKPPVW